MHTRWRTSLQRPELRLLAAALALGAFVVPLLSGDGPREVLAGLLGAWLVTIGLLYALARLEPDDGEDRDV